MSLNKDIYCVPVYVIRLLLRVIAHVQLTSKIHIQFATDLARTRPVSMYITLHRTIFEPNAVILRLIS